MAQATLLSDEEVLAIADAVLKQQLGSVGFDHAEASSGTDHSGEAAIYVRAVLKPGTPILGGRYSSKAHEALDHALMSRGETRFPYFSLHHPDGETPEPESRGSQARA